VPVTAYVFSDLFGPFAGIVTLHWAFFQYVGSTPHASFRVSWIPEEADPIVYPEL
jgi:hypothetical protein